MEIQVSRLWSDLNGIFAAATTGKGTDIYRVLDQGAPTEKYEVVDANGCFKPIDKESVPQPVRKSLGAWGSWYAP